MKPDGLPGRRLSLLDWFVLVLLGGLGAALLLFGLAKLFSSGMSGIT